MSIVQCKFKRVIKSAFLLMILVSVTNCNQFASFTDTEEDAFLSTREVFENPQTSFVGADPADDGVYDDTPEEPEQPEEPESPVVDVPEVPLPPFQWCGKNGNRFQFLKPRNGKYTRCRPCVTKGSRNYDDGSTKVCEVSRCDGKNQYIFFGNKNKPSRSCERCDVLNKAKTKCIVVVKPPEPPEPPTPEDPKKDKDPDPKDPKEPKEPKDPPRVTSDDDDDDGGGGDPLMIDSVGVDYANAEELRNSEASYFTSGDLNLTDPSADSVDSQERARFEGFNLLGQQTTTVLDSGKFMHIKESGKNFKFQDMSWTRRSQKRYRFLALPNSKGNIKGIDQLFGDNTFGPNADKPFAKDGFRALMKYDVVYDGFINKNDPVFKKLRLWHDLNGDGNVDTAAERKSELVSLSQVGITYIHLKPNEKFFETDQHGNDIAYKSIVGFKSDYKNGKKLGTAFDMWFQYQPRELLNGDHATVEEAAAEQLLF